MSTEGWARPRRDGFALALRHDALVEARECGGPLVDRAGRVVAINMARADRSGCYAVPVERVLAGFEELLVADDE
jgi:S1-C subfamily serine protease